MTRNILNSQRRIGIAFAGVMLAVLLSVGLLSTGAVAEVDSTTITTDDPANETVEVSLDFNGSTDATVELSNGSGTVASQTLSGTSGDTLTPTLDPSDASAGETLDLNVTATDESVVSMNESMITRTETVEVSDAGNETLAVDVDFSGDQNASATVTVLDSNGSTVASDTLEYTDSGGATLTAEFNSSDGLEDNATYTVSVESADLSAYDGVSAESTDASGLFGGGMIAGQDPIVVVVALLVLGGGAMYARREEMI
jgi:hypothetical protein